MSLEVSLSILTFIFGLLIGSFLNVVIYRMPRNISVVFPSSACPSCEHKIKWYENFPVLSFLLLKGKCSNCKTKISIKYPLVELFVGFVALFLAPTDLSLPQLTKFFVYFSIAATFIAHFFIDVEHQLLPDKLNLYLLGVMGSYSILYNEIYFWLIGGAIGFLGPLGVTILFYKLRGQIGLGGGDIKLFGILGIFLGPLGILNNIFMSCFLGAIGGILLIQLKKIDKDNPFAFGPFIILVASIQIFFPTLFELINPLIIK